MEFSRASSSVFSMAYSKKVAFASALVTVLILLLVPIRQIDGLSSGAPLAACGSMTPGHGVGGQQSSPPYTTIVSTQMGVANTPITLELRPGDSQTTFKGYLVMAFDLTDNSKPIGTFKHRNQGQLIDCDRGSMNAATHSDSSTKTSVTLEWIPPPNYSGQVVFRTTFVQNKSTFWIKTESDTVSFATTGMSTATTVPIKPSSAGSSQSVNIVANLVVLSLLIFLVR